MKTAVARLLAYSGVGVLAYAALQLNPPIVRPPAEVLARRVASAMWKQSVDTLARGQSLTSLLARRGISGSDAAEAILAASNSVDARRIPAGMAVSIGAASSDSAPSEIVLHLAVDRLVHLVRTDTGWTAREEKLPWTTDTVVVTGTIRSTLYEALDDGAASLLPTAARRQLAWTIADILEYRVDMSRDLQEGDAFRALVERSRGPNGAAKVGKVMALSFSLSGSDLQAIRYENGGSAQYFDASGKSLRAAFLRAPLEFRRISSVFGMRFHPILGVWRAHKGTDYAASQGTPVRAIGDGTVIFAGQKRGYGNVLEIRHRNGYVSRYGHLRGFARGVHAGMFVGIASTVGYVGMTGLATAPHLHFEILVNGAQRDPRTALSRTGGDPIPSAERGAFESLRSRMIATLEQGPGAVRVASRVGGSGGA